MLGPPREEARRRVHIRHVDVRQDDAHFLGLEDLDGGAAVAGFEHLVQRQIRVAQRPLQNHADGNGIVDN
jgi:hypothetical protein